MKSVGCMLLGLAGAALIAAIFKSSAIWVAGFLVGLFLLYSLPQVCLYRPPEDHLGVIYEIDRFSRLVEPDEWVFVIPGLQRVKQPVSLRLRRVEVTLTDLLTQDQFPVDCQLLVFYQLDLRRTGAHFRAQALRIPEEGWQSIIRTVLQETTSEVLSGAVFQHLLTPVGRSHFKRTLSATLAARVQRLGLIVNPQAGISVQVLKPAGAIWQAMVDRLAAVSMGEAALARIYPMLEELSQRHPEVAWETLLLEWAAVMAKDGTLPQVLVAPTRGVTHAVLGGRDQQGPIDGSNAGSAAVDVHDDRAAAMAWMRAQVK